MENPVPDFDLPPVEEKPAPPWLVIGAVVVLIGGLMGATAWWISVGKFHHQGQTTAVTALTQQLDKERAALDAERAKAVEMTQQLEAMKQAYAVGNVPDKKQAMADYTVLEAAHEAQSEKVKTLVHQYNEKLGNLRGLQQ